MAINACKILIINGLHGGRVIKTFTGQDSGKRLCKRGFATFTSAAYEYFHKYPTFMLTNKKAFRSSECFQRK
jgi:hypothetical protein